MTTHELLEHVSLDAMGLLDLDEREAFERAFRAASPALQAQIRREQLRLSHMDDVLPAVDLPPGLRARVMAAVREAIDSMSIRKFSGGAGGAIVPDLRRAYGVSRLWRVGAIACAAASVVLGLSVLQMRFDFADIQTGGRNQVAYDAILKDFGVNFSQSMFDPHTRFVQFSADPVAEGSPFGGRALLIVEGETGKGQLFLKDLPEAGAEYEVVVVDESGREAIADVTIRATGTGVEFRDLGTISVESTREVGIRLRGQAAMLLRSSGI